MDAPRQLKKNEQWRGLYTNADAHDLPDGAMQEQINMAILSPGILSTRKGNRPVTFANAIAAASGNIIAMVHYHRPDGEYAVYQLASGVVKGGRGAT